MILSYVYRIVSIKFKISVANNGAHSRLMWVGNFIVANNVGQKLISFAFNLGQFDTLIAGQEAKGEVPLAYSIT